MPSLDLEACHFPADLFNDENGASDDPDRSWWVMRTKSRQEKAVARDLVRQELPFFLPTTRRVRLGKRGEVESFIPLFPGYVFGRLTETERFAVNRTGRLASFVRVEDQNRFWNELRNLFDLLDRCLEVHPVLQIKEGSVVTIRKGPLKGITGLVQRTAGRCRFVVRIDFLQTGASVHLDEADLELIDGK